MNPLIDTQLWPQTPVQIRKCAYIYIMRSCISKDTVLPQMQASENQLNACFVTMSVIEEEKTRKIYCK